MTTMTPCADLTRRVFLGLETCLAVAAMLHSAHAAVTAGRLQSLQCAVGGPCTEQDGDEATSLVSSGLALAILSNVVLLARLALMHLRYFPRTVGLVYDVLMTSVWVLGLAQLTQSRATARNLSTGSVVATDGVVVTCWRLRGVVVAAAAVALYAARLLFELVCLCCAYRPTSEYRPIEQDEWELELEKGHVRTDGLAPAQAYSPVLAFFPDDD